MAAKKYHILKAMQIFQKNNFFHHKLDKGIFFALICWKIFVSFSCLWKIT
jgi:hypothetical protein